MRRFITIGETWIYYHDSELIQEAKDWGPSEFWTGLQKKIVILQQAKAPVHTVQRTIAKVMELQYELFQYTTYSSDLVTSGFWLFPGLKKTVDIDYHQMKK